MMRAEILLKQGEDFIVDDATETRYQLASASKQFTAAAARLLVEAGTLILDDRVVRWRLVGGLPSSFTNRDLFQRVGQGGRQPSPMLF